jgi:RimJ/RimL family protein N-acetyltransferase
MLIREGRVTLRRLERADLPRVVDWFNRPDLRRNLLRLWPMSIVEEEQWFDAQRGKDWPKIYAIVTAEGEHIGNIGVHDVDWRSRSAEIGIMIGEPARQDQGYGAEAIRALLRHLFDHMGLNRVSLSVFADNPRAIRCYEKCGFVQEGRLRQADFRDGCYVDELVMAILREDYLASPAGRLTP